MRLFKPTDRLVGSGLGIFQLGLKNPDTSVESVGFYFPDQNSDDYSRNDPDCYKNYIHK